MSDDAPAVDWYPTFKQIRMRKILNGDPCPCKSGLKYWKCCALRPEQQINVISPMYRQSSTNT